MMRNRSSMLAAIAVGMLALLALDLTSCGVPLDSAPRAINRTTTTIPDQPTVPASDAVGAPKVNLYFLAGDRLTRSSVAAESKATPELAIGLVLSTEPDAPLQTRIPPGTSLLSLRIQNKVASIDLTDAIEDISGPSQKEAYAQIVFTALESDRTITRVRFLVQGKSVDAPTDKGNKALVSASDFARPLNPN